MKNKNLLEIQLFFAVAVMLTGLMLSFYIENVVLNELSKSLTIITGMTVMHICSLGNQKGTS
ncbi:hypothetical protein JMN32_18140 [Fulvivirga sp. 29W222]|uniref:Uncharacterized protein n=1 Tax=Fulvivirga marina TaxID=2494733 RepID=A0A937FY22_9BACT|nr:hypothetical protein [Fulvivirga marina]MBL6448240.1 hypothetical protein [Fulvivirga marina]